jgi:hypothetical protein
MSELRAESFAGEQWVFEPRTSDPGTIQEGHRWLRTDLNSGDKIATLRVDVGDSIVDVPVFPTGTAEDTVSEALRIRVGGQDGYVPIAPEAEAAFPALRVQHSGQLHAYHDRVSPGAAIPDSVDHQWSHDEGAGTTLTDNIGAVNGSISGATWTSLADAVGGYYLSYDGTNDVTSLGDDPFPFLYSGDYTITAFVKVADTNNNYDIFGHDNGSDAGLSFGISGGALIINHANVDFYSGLPVTTSWSFIAIRYDSDNTSVTLDVNDQTDAGNNLSQPADPGPSATYGFGKRFGLDANYFNGGVDEITISQGFLSDSDLESLRARRSDI